MEFQVKVLYAIVFINLLGFGVMIPILPYIAIHLHANAVKLGMMTVAFSFAQMIGNMCLGIASDRIGCKKVLLICMVGSGLSYFFFGIVEDLNLLILFRGISGFFSGTIGVAQSFVSLIVPEKQRGEYLGYIGACIGAGFAIGPGFGGFLTSVLGFEGPCFVSAAMCLVVAAAGVFILDDVQHAEHDVETKTEEKKQTTTLGGLMLEKPQCLSVMTSTAAYYAAFAAFEAMGALYFLSVFGMSSSKFGMICTLSGIGAFVLQRFFVKRILESMGDVKAGVAGHLSRVLGYLIVVVCPLWWSPYIMGMILPLGSVLSPVAAALLSKLSPSDLRGSVLGLNQTFAALGRVVGPLVASVLYDQNPESLWYGAVAFSAVGAVLLLSIRTEKAPAASDLKAPLVDSEDADGPVPPIRPTLSRLETLALSDAHFGSHTPMTLHGEHHDLFDGTFAPGNKSPARKWKTTVEASGLEKFREADDPRRTSV